jgi:uncharacterized protein YgfB (UPF0149 family)
MNQNKSTSTSWALILITIAVVGAGISYHFTLESRFAAIEQKLDQNSLALQQYQASQETIVSSKAQALDNLNKEVDTLQASLGPLGKATQEQTESLTDLRKQIASLQQSQQAEQDTQKKLSDYAGQLEKIKHDIQAQASQVAAPTVTPAPVTSPALAPHASASEAPLPLPPRADSAIDLRPAQVNVAIDASVRALPVALPAIVTASDVR